MAHRVLVGGYLDSVSILVFDPSQSPERVLKLESSTKIGQSPSWVGRHPAREDVAIATLEGENGVLAVMKVGTDGAGVEVVQRVSTEGGYPCHIEWLHDQVVVSNYGGANIFFARFSSRDGLPLDEASTQSMAFEGTGPKIRRQEESHPHQAVLNPESDKEELLIPDLGADKIWRLHKDGAGSWALNGVIDFEKGHGPRHIAIHEGILYSVGELTATIHAHLLPPFPAPATLLAILDTLESPLPPEDYDQLPAEILISPSGSKISPPLIYLSNRDELHPEGDSIVVFTPVSQESNTPLANVGRLRTGLQNLRGMVISPDPDGKYLIVGGSVSGGIKVYERLPGGVDFKEIAFYKGVGSEKPTSFAWL